MTRTSLGLTCDYCGSGPDMPCEVRELDPLDGVCLLEEDLSEDQEVTVNYLRSRNARGRSNS
jgi:hypothetical protein